MMLFNLNSDLTIWIDAYVCIDWLKNRFRRSSAGYFEFSVDKDALFHKI